VYADKYGFRIIEKEEFYIPAINLDHMNFNIRHLVMR